MNFSTLFACFISLTLFNQILAVERFPCVGSRHPNGVCSNTNHGPPISEMVWDTVYDAVDAKGLVSPYFTCHNKGKSNKYCCSTKVSGTQAQRCVAY